MQEFKIGDRVRIKGFPSLIGTIDYMSGDICRIDLEGTDGYWFDSGIFLAQFYIHMPLELEDREYYPCLGWKNAEEF